MRRKFKKKSVFLKLFAVIVFIFVIPFLIFKIKLFNINKVEVLSKDLECVSNEQVKDILQIEGKNLFTIDNLKLEQNIKEKFICVKNIKVTRSYPSKINLDLFARQPKAKVLTWELNDSTSSAVLENIATPAAQLAQDSYLVDEEGVLFAKTSVFFDPAIFLDGTDLTLGKKMNESFKNSLKILERLKIFKVKASSSVISDNYFVVYSLPKIIFKLDNEVDTQIASLQLILEKAKIDSEELEFIDLRFDKPIVRFAPKKK